MFRPLITLLCLASFALAIAAGVLWGRSRKAADVFALRSPWGHLDGVAADHGGLLFVLSDVPFEGFVSTSQTEWPAGHVAIETTDMQTLHDAIFDPSAKKWSALGFRVAMGNLTLNPTSTAGGWTYQALLLPYWFVILLLAVPPFLVARRRLQRRRWRLTGRCVECGYDLRATTDRCPECGDAVPVKSPLAQSVS